MKVSFTVVWEVPSCFIFRENTTTIRPTCTARQCVQCHGVVLAGAAADIKSGLLARVDRT